MRDNDRILLGNDDDLAIYHNAIIGNSVIADQGGGNLSLHTNDSEINMWNQTRQHHLLKAIGSGAVELYYNGTKRFETKSDGAKVTGNLEVTGNLDVDGTTELDGLNVDGDTTLNDTTVDGVLDVNGRATIDNVTIDNSTVTATRFQGKADEADRIRIVNGTSGDQYPVMANNVGQQTLHRDTRLKFNGGTLTVSNDLVAFASDDRLKTNRVGLTDALDKVCSLNGFTFNFNETGGELGFSTDIRYVGVSAQEVQKVLPEAVKPAGADENYITVQYEKIVPLLIEAIKELSDKVSALEDKLNN